MNNKQEFLIVNETVVQREIKEITISSIEEMIKSLDFDSQWIIDPDPFHLPFESNLLGRSWTMHAAPTFEKINQPTIRYIISELNYFPLPGCELFPLNKITHPDYVTYFKKCFQDKDFNRWPIFFYLDQFVTSDGKPEYYKIHNGVQVEPYIPYSYRNTSHLPENYHKHIITVNAKIKLAETQMFLVTPVSKQEPQKPFLFCYRKPSKTIKKVMLPNLYGDGSICLGSENLRSLPTNVHPFIYQYEVAKILAKAPINHDLRNFDAEFGSLVFNSKGEMLTLSETQRTNVRQNLDLEVDQYKDSDIETFLQLKLTTSISGNEAFIEFINKVY